MSEGGSSAWPRDRAAAPVFDLAEITKGIPWPHNNEAEQGLLGALMVQNRALDRVREKLSPEHFSNPVHGRIYAAICQLVDSGRQANPVTLKGLFDQDGSLGEVGGAQYLVKLAASIVAIVNAEDYADTILDMHIRRATILAGFETVGNALAIDLEVPGTQVVEDAEARLRDLAFGVDKTHGLAPLGAAARLANARTEAAYKAGGVSGISTRLTDLDRQMGGLQPTDLIIIAARPSMGKSDLAVNIADNAARAGEKVALFSLEMSAEQVAMRMIARRSEISADRQIQGQVQPLHFTDLAKATADIETLPFFVDDSPASSVQTIAARARRHKRQYGLTLLVVDYLQLIAPGNNRRNREVNRVQEVSAITQGLKALAKELGIPVIALSQLSRAVESREDKRPMLSDLRESGSIEQDADIVAFLYREAYYLQRQQPEQRLDESAEKFGDRYDTWKTRLAEVLNIAEVIVAKRRLGPTGITRLFYAPEFSRFSNFQPTDGGGHHGG